MARLLPFYFVLFAALRQPHASPPPAVFGDELNAGLFEGSHQGFSRFRAAPDLATRKLQPFDGRDRNSRVLRLGPPETSQPRFPPGAHEAALSLLD